MDISETRLVDIMCSVYKLENGNWKSLDGGKSRLAVCEATPTTEEVASPNPAGKYRIVALSNGNEVTKIDYSDLSVPAINLLSLSS